MTDNCYNQINLPSIKQDSNDILFAIYTHFSSVPPSIADVIRVLENNNLGFVGINSYDDVFLMKSLKKLTDDVMIIIFKELSLCRNNAIVYSKNYNRNMWDSIKINFISNNLLNKYIDFYWWKK